MPDGSNLVIGQVNTGTSTTDLQTSGQGVVARPALVVGTQDNGALLGVSWRSVGVQGQSHYDAGVFGSSDQGTGVLGQSDGGFGVMGYTNSGDNFGVIGLTGPLDDPEADSGGVWGQTGPRAVNWPAVGGYSFGGAGVQGVSVAPAGNNFGVLGISQNGHGVVGYTTSLSRYGGVFLGGLVVKGTKSSAVRHPDGSHRLLYCMESPESWFEDFGRAKLVRGRSTVKLDPGFAAVVRTNDYHGFLCPEGDVKGLYVSRRNRVGFEVREHEGGKSSATFSYRVVARRKDIKGERFAKAVLPELDTRKLLKTPKAIEKIVEVERRNKKTRRDMKRHSVRRTK